jgi:hypothetical protein
MRLINFILVLLVVCSASCTMEKRLYTAGYNVNWKYKNGLKDKVDLNDSLLLNEKKVSTIIQTKNTTKRALKIDTKKQIIDEVSSQANQGVVHYDVKMFSKRDFELLDVKDNIKKKWKVSNIKHIKTTKSSPEPRRREVHLLTKIALVLIGVGLLLLIISFWAWYFSLISAVSGVTSGFSGSYMFLVSGLATLALGLVLLIFRWITS